MRERGLTLTELLIVLAIIAILAAIAVPTYSGIKRRSMKRARDADLQAIKLAVEQYRAINRTYGPPPNCPNPMVFESLDTGVITDDISSCYPGSNLGNQPKPYDFQIEVCDNGNQFRLCATGRSGTLVEGDEWCVDESNNWGESTIVDCP